MTFEMGRGALRVVCFELEPDVGMTQVRHPIDPEPDRPELEDATFRFLLNQGQAERVAVKGDRLLVSVMRALDRDIRAAGEIWVVDVGDHERTGDFRIREPLVRPTNSRKN